MDRSGTALTRHLVLGLMPRDAAPESHIAAGAWCFAGQEELFPDWAGRYEFAPEPLAQVSLLPDAVAAAQALASQKISFCAQKLCPYAEDLPPSYWETLLAPWIIEVATQIVERALRVQAMRKAYGDIPLALDLLPEGLGFDFADDCDFRKRGSLGLAYNHWLFSRLLELDWPKAWQKNILPQVNSSSEAASEATPGIAESLRLWLRKIQLKLPFPKLKGLGVGQAMRFSLALLHQSKGADQSLSLLHDFGNRQALNKLGLASPKFDKMAEQVFSQSLPRSLTRLEHPPQIDKKRPRTRIASILAYEDADYRQSLALWRAQGKRLAYVQHGGNYGQALVSCDTTFVEYSQDAFFTWGWQSHGQAKGNFIPLPYPQLCRIRDAWQGQNGDYLLFVGTEMLSFGYRLDAHPTPLQLLEYRKDKALFFENLGRELEGRSFYRPYFPLPSSLDDAQWLLPRFPHLRLCSGALLPKLLASRLLILDHHGTSMLEALSANVPCILYWDPKFTPLTPEANSLLGLLRDAGIWYASPKEAALKARAVWEDPKAWWQDAKIQDARNSYCQGQAQNCAHEDPLWIAALKNL